MRNTLQLCVPSQVYQPLQSGLFTYQDSSSTRTLSRATHAWIRCQLNDKHGDDGKESLIAIYKYITLQQKHNLWLRHFPSTDKHIVYIITSLRRGILVAPSCSFNSLIVADGPASRDVPVSAIALQSLQ